MRVLCETEGLFGVWDNEGDMLIPAQVQLLSFAKGPYLGSFRTEVNDLESLMAKQFKYQ